MKEYTNIKADDFCCIGALLETVLIRNNYTNYRLLRLTQFSSFGVWFVFNVLSDMSCNFTYNGPPEPNADLSVQAHLLRRSKSEGN